MPVAGWIALVGGGVLSGAMLVAILVAPRSLEPLFGMAGIACLTSAGWGFIMVLGHYERSDIAIAGLILGFGGILGGYGLSASLLPLFERVSLPSSIGDAVPSGDGHIHVVLLAEAESETYDIRATARELSYITEGGAPATPLAVMPFFYTAQKTRYHAVSGASPSRQVFEAIRQRVATVLGEEAASVSLAWTDTTLELARRIGEKVAEGARHVVVAPVAVSESPLSERSLREVDALRPKAHGVRIVVAPPLWGSSGIATLVADRIAESHVSGLKTGVVLVCHGLPPRWGTDHPSFEAQQTAFAHRVRLLICEHGFAEADVRIGWAEWRDPDVTESVRHLAALGCANVLVVPACDPTETLVTLLDLPHATTRARAEIAWRVLPAWGDEEAVALEIARSVREAADDL